MEQGVVTRRFRWVMLAAIAAGLFWLRAIVWQVATQLFFGMLVSLAALPVMKRLQRRFSAGTAASLSMLVFSVSLAGLVLLLAPPLIRQGKQLMALLPTLYGAAERFMQRAQDWLLQNGVAVDETMKTQLLQKGQQALAMAAPTVMAWLRALTASVSKRLLAPMFAFYFLRDRALIGQWLLSLVPIGRRGLTVRILREMRRETAGYLRGQLLVSGVVGILTAVGLLFCGVPAWLVLGVAMGLLELIPYVGPFLGGVLVALFSLPSGFGRTLWALGVVVVVQQLEGGMLSPQVMSGATRLHPVAVLVCVMVGGAAGGVGGILLSIPLLLCARAALRVVSLSRTDET